MPRPIVRHVEQAAPRSPRVVAPLERTTRAAVAVCPGDEHGLSIGHQQGVGMPLADLFGSLGNDNVPLRVGGDVDRGDRDIAIARHSVARRRLAGCARCEKEADCEHFGTQCLGVHGTLLSIGDGVPTGNRFCAEPCPRVAASALGTPIARRPRHCQRGRRPGHDLGSILRPGEGGPQSMEACRLWSNGIDYEAPGATVCEHDRGNMGVAVARIAGVRLPGEVSLERPPPARRQPGGRRVAVLMRR